MIVVCNQSFYNQVLIYTAISTKTDTVFHYLAENSGQGLRAHIYILFALLVFETHCALKV